MRTSESIDQLAVALNKTQGEIKDLAKNTQGFGYKYATLDQLLELNRPIWVENGLSIVQMPLSSPNNNEVVLETVILHTSGQWLSSEMSMPIAEHKKMSVSQQVGTAITYSRRYSLSALLGLAAMEDNDAAPYREANTPNVMTPKKANNVYINKIEAENMVNNINLSKTVDEVGSSYINALSIAMKTANKDKVIAALTEAKDIRLAFLKGN